MSEPNHLKLRTTIMVAGMIILPLAAVVGIKLPASLRSDGAWTSEKSQSPALASRPVTAAAPKTSAPSPSASTAEQSAKIPPEPSNYPVAQAKNIDVRAIAEPAVRSASAAEGFAAPSSRAAVAQFTEPSEVQANDDFTWIQQRLRALGATHYSLETWGTTGDAYRFQCRMSAGHDANYSRHFEATDVEPLRAMRIVLDEVESWKVGRLP